MSHVFQRFTCFLFLSRFCAFNVSYYLNGFYVYDTKKSIIITHKTTSCKLGKHSKCGVSAVHVPRFCQSKKSTETRNVGQCPTWWSPCGTRWRPLFNAAKFGWRSLLNCRAVTLPRRESRWNLQGCPKLINRSQPLVGRSSPYCGDMRRTYCCLIGFSDCRYVP